MDLFKFASDKEPVEFYSRNPSHIQELIKFYFEKVRDEGRLESSGVASWVRKVPIIGEIQRVEEGKILYHAGILSTYAGAPRRDNESFYSEIMKITPDFVVASSREGLDYFESEREQLRGDRNKRGNLWKFLSGRGETERMTFIPEDIRDAILSYDVKSLFEKDD